MEVDFLELINVARTAAKAMRNKKPSRALIQQVTSTRGQRGVQMFDIYYASNGLPRQRHLAYNNMSTKDAVALRNKSQARDPVKGVKVKYQLAIMKEPPLRVLTGADAYKAVMAKIEVYEEN